MVKAMVLCAGLGTRLRPLTLRWPKPAMPLLGQPLLRYALATLKRGGVTAVGINTHHLPEVMEATAQAECARAGLPLSVSREEGEIQGTGGGIRGLRDFLRDDTFVVLNGDVLFGCDLAGILAAHQASGADATMVLGPLPEGEKYNPVELDFSHRVRRIAGHGPGGDRLTAWHFTGAHVMSPAVFDFMSASGAEDINHHVYPRMLAKGLTIHGHRIDPFAHYWSDLGTPARYFAAHRDLLFGQVGLGPFAGASPFEDTPRGAGNWWAHPTAQLSNLRAAGPAWFGKGCVLEEGVTAGSGTSVGPGAHVGQGAMLNRTVVLDGAEVEGGQLYEDCLLAPGGVRIALG
ncbi:MAG: Mannose-phosphate guanylyltransferase [Myxococcaceae bacterium]|nr:Mannose-phosphate guanylyltransferase [Myxococcaceae bacterium]